MIIRMRVCIFHSGEIIEVIKTVRYVVVRKEHRCGYCDKPIPKGEKAMEYDDGSKVVHIDCYWAEDA